MLKQYSFSVLSSRSTFPNSDQSTCACSSAGHVDDRPTAPVAKPPGPEELCLHGVLVDVLGAVLARDGRGVAGGDQAQPGIAEADVVLVGVSRSSKTPTCFYLANCGIKAANIPLVPSLPEPPGLDTVECPVVGLTLQAVALIEIRRHRLRLIAAGDAAGIARQNSSEYVDEDAVKAELLWARRLCNRRGWPVIDVTRRSIEETAATVLQLMEAWHERKRKAAEGSP